MGEPPLRGFGKKGVVKMAQPILITGAQGQVGFELQRALAPLGPLRALDRPSCDVTDPDALKHRILEIRPRVIVNAAAYTAVDRAETEPALAEAVNTVAPSVLGEAAAAVDALVVHYSTDYVFDGASDRPYREEDTPNPLSVYGRTKLMGERALAAATPRHLILRTSWVFDTHGSNFLKTMLRLMAERESLKVVGDQFGAPTSAALIADITAQLVECFLQQKSFPFGLYHLTASGATSWFEYAVYIAAAARRVAFPIKLNEKGLRSIPSADYPLPAQRPANSRLDCGQLERAFGLILPPWQTGVNHVLAQLLHAHR